MSRIEVRELTKKYGPVAAVENLSFTVEPGTIVGFLGPNGSGKTTTLRILTGLATATSGAATFNGLRYAELPFPVREVGVLLEARATHPSRTARDHLRVLAAAAGIGSGRVDEVLDLVGLTAAARRRVGAFSLGMHQRLGLAAALMGDPPVLVLDEPANGLDPDGIRWMRELLLRLRAEGRAVVVSSHVLSEVDQVADRVVVIARGRLIENASLDELRYRAGRRVRVRSTDPTRLRALLDQAGASADDVPGSGEGGELMVTGLSSADIGALATHHGVTLVQIHDDSPDLESVFLQLTATEGAIR